MKKLRLNKNIIISIAAALVLMICTIAPAFTTAYLTDGEMVVNEFLIKSITLDEPEVFEPGLPEYTKTVRITNVQSANGDGTDAFVRVKIVFSDAYMQKFTGICTAGTKANGPYYSALYDGIGDGSNDFNLIFEDGEYATDNGSTGLKTIMADSFLNHLPEGWVFIREDSATEVRYKDPMYPENGDDGDPSNDITYRSTEGDLLGGYFYYTLPLAPGETTPDLIKYMRTLISEDDAALDFNIYVYAEATQVKNHLGQRFTGTDAWRQAWIEVMARTKTNSH